MLFTLYTQQCRRSASGLDTADGKGEGNEREEGDEDVALGTGAPSWGWRKTLGDLLDASFGKNEMDMRGILAKHDCLRMWADFISLCAYYGLCLLILYYW